MSETPKVIISGFADEGPADKKAEAQLTMLATLGMSHYSLRFVDAGQGRQKCDAANTARDSAAAPIARRIRDCSGLDWLADWQGQAARRGRRLGQRLYPV